MKWYKAVLGCLVIVFMGFLTFIGLATVGYMVALTFMIIPLWQVGVGTAFGTVMVILHLLYGGKK